MAPKHWLFLPECLLAIPLVAAAVGAHQAGLLAGTCALACLPVYILLRLWAWRIERRLLQQLNAACERNTQLVEQNQEIQGQLVQTTQSLHELRDTATQQINKLSLQNRQRTKLLAHQDASLQTKHALNVDLVARLKKAHTAIRQLLVVRDERDQLQESVARLTTEMGEARAHAEQREVAADHQLAAKQQTIEELDAQVQTATGKLNSLVENLAESQRSETLAAQQMARLTDEVDAAAQQITRLTNSNRAATQRATILEEAVESLRAELTTTEEAMLKSHTKILVLQESLDSEEEQVRLLRAGLERKGRELEHCQHELIAEHRTAVELTRQVSELTAQLTAEQFAADTLKREAREWRVQFETLVVVEAEARTQREQLAAALATTESELTASRHERNQIRLGLNNSSQQVEQAEAALLEVRNQLEETTKRADDLADRLQKREHAHERAAHNYQATTTEMTRLLEAAEVNRFELEQKLDSAQQGCSYAIDRADRLASQLASVQSRLVES